MATSPASRSKQTKNTWHRSVKCMAAYDPKNPKISKIDIRIWYKYDVLK